jgi:hypothetical protein
MYKMFDNSWQQIAIVTTVGRSHRFLMERFILEKLNLAERKEQFPVEVSNRFAALEELDAKVEINSAWETIRENINISAKESLGYFELKHIREELRLRVFEDRVLRRIFGPKRDEVTGERRKLRNEELRNLYSSPNIIKIIKSMRSDGRGM